MQCLVLQYKSVKILEAKSIPEEFFKMDNFEEEFNHIKDFFKYEDKKEREDGLQKALKLMIIYFQKVKN